MKTKVTLKHFKTDCLWKHFFDSISSQTPSNLIFLNISNPKVFDTVLT